MSKSISQKIKVYFDKSVDLVFAVILVFIILGTAIGTAQLFVTTWKLLAFEAYSKTMPRRAAMMLLWEITKRNLLIS